jgi:hypothetical protein
MYKLKWYFQVFLYVIGIPVHINDECVLDFSCCYKNLSHPFTYRLNVTLGRIVYGYWTRLIKK